MACEIFTDKLLQDAKLSSASIETSFITSLTNSYTPEMSGIWQPLVIKPDQTDIDHRELLSSAGDDLTPEFNPCSCNNNIFGNGTGVLDIYNSQDFSSTPNIEIDSSYCNTCDGAGSADSKCEVRSQKDDYIPKIPYLYQGYIREFYDFKNMKQFPSCSNVGLGKEKFITMDLKSFDTKLNIDLKLQETISEVDYDPYATRHDTEYIHDKSYKKSKMKSQTCGVFISKTGTIPPSITKPYGFTKNTYNNIYIGTEKIASHWKWNYQSGILGWYRHYDTQRPSDTRPIPGMDLYIPPGDVFFAKPDGPEYSDISSETACPSGLKVVKNNSIDKIIGNDETFFYISENIYDKFISFRRKVNETSVELNDAQIIDKALILSTHPAYDNIITNLHSVSIDEDRNGLGQLTLLNQMMTSGTRFASAFGIYHCDTKEALIKTLAHKYGAYIFVEPDSTKTLKPTSVSSESYSIDLNFDMVIPENKVTFNSANGAMLPDEVNYTRDFRYEQEFKVGGEKIVETYHNVARGFDETCDDGTYTKTNHANYASLFFYNSQVSSHINNSGSYYLESKYTNKQPDLIRKYPAKAFNPHVDLVAVHKQGGIYANSLPFNLKEATFFVKDKDESPEGQIEIKFTTKDCGIKIYDIAIKRLQTDQSSSKQCERFPYSTGSVCQCYGFGTRGDLGLPTDDIRQFYGDSNAKTLTGTKKYTPNLSTNNSPTLSRYGGYSQNYLNALFGAGVLSAGGTISQLSSKINPLFPYGEEKQDSVTLPNYVNSYWTVKLKNLGSNSSAHLDTIVSVSENVSLTANRFTGDPSSEDYLSNHNMAWKKFTTKVTINSKNIYDQQADSISVSDNTDISVKLQNPFLAKLTGDSTTVYASPDNSVNGCSSTPTLYSSRGDESSSVTLTFTRKPRKQLLNFHIPPPKSYGELTRAEYNPNKGLKNGSSTNNPFKNNKPYYDNDFTSEPDWDKNKGILYGPLDTALTSLAARVGDFEAARKLKLYMKIGDIWYTVGGNKRHSYEVNDKLYIGRPKLFEYLKNVRDSQKIPMLFPLSPKKLFSWNIFLNHPKPLEKNDEGLYVANLKDNELKPTYPFINGRDTILPTEDKQTKTLIYPGTRYYFMIDEELNIETPVGTFQEENPNTGDDEDVEREIGLLQDVPKITSNYPAGTIVNLDDNKYYYVGGGTNKIENYFYIGTNYKDLIKLDNNLEIRYDENTLHGYIYNSKKKCDHEIKFFEDNKGLITSRTAKIVAKEIIVESLDTDGKPTLRNIAKYNIYTKFTLDTEINSKKFFSADIANYDSSTSLCLYLNQRTTDTSEYLYQERMLKENDGIRLKGSKFEPEELAKLNWFILTKWSDVIKYNNDDPLSDLILKPTQKIEDIYPASIYNNWFYKQIVNSFQNDARFKITNNTTDENKVISSSDVLYCILQKYNVNVNPETINLKNYRDYHNFIPMMDITITDKSLGDLFDQADIQYLTSYGAPVHGSIKSANWTYEHDDYANDGFLDPDTKRFWINVEKDDLIEAAYVPAGDGAYSETLRLDDPLFWLDSTSKSTTKSTAGVRTTFTPTSNTLSSEGHTIKGFGHETKTRDYAFSIHNVYGDGDDKGECGAQGATDCFISTRGSVSLKAKLKMAKSAASKSSVSNASEFFFTYDGGTYSALGQKNLIQISRSELKPDNPLDSAFDHCSTNYIRPDYKRTFVDPERTKKLKEGASVTHTDATKELDKYANEILFRMLYGENDKVNKHILNSTRKPLTADDLLNFTEPKITAADVYDEILYNYDTKASCGCVQGSFNVRGPATIGTSYSFTVGDKDIYFDIDHYGGALRATGRIGGKTVNAIIAQTQSIKTGVSVTDVNTTLSNTENTTYTLQKTSSGSTSKYYGAVTGRIYTGTYGIGVRDYGRVKAPHQNGQPANDIGYHGAVIPPNSSTSSIAIDNGGTNFASWVPGAKVNIRWGGSSSSGGGCPDKTCDDYEIGYCRRKSGCNTDACDGDEDMENFLYSFQQCRTTFNVYGHKYKISNIVEEEEEEEDPTEDDSSTDDDRESVGQAMRIAGGGRVSLNCPQQSGRAREEGGCLIECQGVRGASATVAGSCARGITCCGPWGGMIASQKTRDELHRQFDAQYGSSFLGDPIYNQWQRDVGMRPQTNDPQNGDSPLTGDPGYDVCGFASHNVSIPARKYWTYRTVTGSTPNYNCPISICTISYTNRSITLTIGSQKFCIKSETDGCPYLSATLPAHAYITSDNVTNDCEEGNKGEVILETQSQNFQTLTYTHKEYLGGMSGADVNPLGAVATAIGHNCGLFSRLACQTSYAYALCGGNTWWHAPITDSRGTFGMALAAWKSRMTAAFNNIDSEIGAEFSWHPKGPPAAAGDGGVERVRHVCNANNHISSSDIVQGIIPGTCSDMQFETTSKSYAKYGYDGYDIVSSTATQYTVRAYITYSYKRPVTIQDKLKGWSADSDSYACAQDGKNRTSQHNNAGYDDYPEWYAQSLGIETRDTLGYDIHNYGRSSNFVRRKTEYTKQSSCGDSLTSCEHDDYNKGGNPQYPYGGAPCGRNDYLCWSKNRDWISVWLDYE